MRTCAKVPMNLRVWCVTLPARLSKIRDAAIFYNSFHNFTKLKNSKEPKIAQLSGVPLDKLSFKILYYVVKLSKALVFLGQGKNSDRIAGTHQTRRDVGALVQVLTHDYSG